MPYVAPGEPIAINRPLMSILWLQDSDCRTLIAGIGNPPAARPALAVALYGLSGPPSRMNYLLHFGDYY